jgi:predicted ribosomally synthesized peptide with SipW-like signal peptide
MVVGLVAIVSSVATYAAFSSSTSVSSNTYSAGTVFVSDDDAGGAMWSVSGQLPGATVTRCIRVTYTGTLDADVKLYTTSGASALDPYLTLTVEEGSMPGGTAFPACAGFSSESTLYAGSLSDFKASRTGYASGDPAYPGAQSRWNQNDSLVYRFSVQLGSSYAAQGLSSTIALTWEARNQ